MSREVLQLMCINWDFMKHLDDKQCIHPAARKTISTAQSHLLQMDKDIHVFLSISLGGSVKVSLIVLTRSLKSLCFQHQVIYNRTSICKKRHATSMFSQP